MNNASDDFWEWYNKKYPPFPTKEEIDTNECEKECDLEYQRNAALCEANWMMRGRKPEAYRICMNEVRRIYIECYQECARGECE